MAKHMKFLPRTVLVKNNDITEAYGLLSKVLGNEGVPQQAVRWQYFERPCYKRQRLCYERCRRIYDSEMRRKIQFLMRKNRKDPFPR